MHILEYHSSLAILIVYLITTPLFYFSDAIVDYIKTTGIVTSMFLKVISNFADVLLTFSIFTILYYFSLYRKMGFKKIYVGALVAAVLWVIGKHIIIIFFKYFADFDLVYGAAGTTVTFLFWIYISSMIFLVGAEINSLKIDNSSLIV
jgi:membrane protein